MYSVIEGIKTILDDDGVFISESHYLVDLIKTVQYDSIYREHLKYYSLHSLVKLFQYYDLEIFDIEFIKNYGGSTRVYTGRKGKHKIKDSVQKCIDIEKYFFDNSNKTLNDFRKKIFQNKNKIIKIINEYRSSGKKVVGIGCPGRSSTFLNYCEVDEKKVVILPNKKLL